MERTIESKMNDVYTYSHGTVSMKYCEVQKNKEFALHSC